MAVMGGIPLSGDIILFLYYFIILFINLFLYPQFSKIWIGKNKDIFTPLEILV